MVAKYSGHVILDLTQVRFEYLREKHIIVIKIAKEYKFSKN